MPLIAGIAAAALFLLLGENTYLRVAATAVLLFTPGLLFVRIVVRSGLGMIETVTLGVGLSLAFIVLSGLILNAFGALSSTGWTTVTGLLAVTSVLFWKPGMDGQLSMARSSPRPMHWAAILSAVAISGVALEFARSGAIAHQQYSFTQFWITPPNTPGAAITVGLKNDEKVETAYDVSLLADGANVSRVSNIALSAGESWSRDIPVTTQIRKAKRLEAWLFRSEAPDEIYRKVWISWPPAPSSFIREKD